MKAKMLLWSHYRSPSKRLWKLKFRIVRVEMEWTDTQEVKYIRQGDGLDIWGGRWKC